MTMQRLITVRLHGPLADAYGAEHRFAIRNPREAVFALDANYPGFRRAFLAYQFYDLFVDGLWLPPEAANDDPASAPASQSIDIAPRIEGGGFLLAPLIGAALGLAASSAAVQIISGLIVAAVLIGVSLLLAPKPKKKEAEDSKKDENYMFSGPENVTEQGVAVPVIYGRVHVGSVVISAGLELGETYVPALASTSPAPTSGVTTGPVIVVVIPGSTPGDNIYGPAGWNYFGWGGDWSPDSQSMVYGHVFVSPDGLTHYNSQTGQYYVGPPPGLNEPRSPETPGGGS
jgi:predicted phage tail protein